MAKTRIPSTQIKNFSLQIEDLKDFAPEDGGGLNVNVKAGRIRNDNTITDKSSQVVALTDNTTNYVELDTLGVASDNTTGFTAGSIPIAIVVTSGADITSVTDKRAWITITGNKDISARVFNSSNISIANSTTVLLDFDTDEFDTDTIHDVVTNKSRLTAKTKGKYFITGHVKFAARTGSSHVLEILIRFTGASTIDIADHRESNSPTGVLTQFSIATFYELDVGDYVELGVFQNSGNSVNVLSAAGDSSPEFGMIKIA